MTWKNELSSVDRCSFQLFNFSIGWSSFNNNLIADGASSLKWQTINYFQPFFIFASKNCSRAWKGFIFSWHKRKRLQKSKVFLKELLLWCHFHEIFHHEFSSENASKLRPFNLPKWVSLLFDSCWCRNIKNIVFDGFCPTLHIACWSQLVLAHLSFFSDGFYVSDFLIWYLFFNFTSGKLKLLLVICLWGWRWCLECVSDMKRQTS